MVPTSRQHSKTFRTPLDLTRCAHASTDQVDLWQLHENLRTRPSDMRFPILLWSQFYLIRSWKSDVVYLTASFSYWFGLIMVSLLSAIFSAALIPPRPSVGSGWDGPPKSVLVRCQPTTSPMMGWIRVLTCQGQRTASAATLPSSSYYLKMHGRPICRGRLSR